MTVPHTGHGAEPVLVEEFRTGFFLYMLAQAVAALVLVLGVARMGIDHGADLYPDGRFETIATQRVCGKAEFDRRLHVRGRQFCFFVMVRIRNIGEVYGIRGILDAYAGIAKKDMVGGDPGTKGKAQVGIVFKREIEKEINIKAFGKTAFIDGVRDPGPSGIAKLHHKMVVGPVAHVNGLFLFLFGFRAVLRLSSGRHDH